MVTRSFPFLAAVLALSALGGCSGSESGTEGEGAEAPAGTLDAEQQQKMGITTEAAKPAGSIPLASVPGTITLPPEARVAVTAPFPGAAVRLYVIEGQSVRKGQPLAQIRAAEPVQISGELSRSQAQLALAEARAARLSQLAEEGVIAGARAEEAKAALEQARASVAENRRLLALAGAGPDGTMTLRAPISGRVAHVAIEAGGPVDGMTAPFVIENDSAYRIDLQLPERLAREVRPGMAVEVELAGDGGAPVTVGGQILSVAPSIDPMTRSVMAKASIGAVPGLVAGRNVMVVISGEGSAAGVSVPAAAVSRIGDADYVFVRTGDRFARRKVTVVAAAGGRSVISGGLKAGEVVATGGIPELKAMTAE